MRNISREALLSPLQIPQFCNQLGTQESISVEMLNQFQQQNPNGGPQMSATGQQQQDQQPPPTMQTMRLRDDPPAITPVNRSSRKRKSPPANNPDLQQPPPQPQPPIQHVLPSGHPLMHPLSGSLAPPGYQYSPADFSPGGMPPQPHEQSPSGDQSGSQGRALSSSKRAEQNRKAQRAFRERRDQHVKALESRSQLLDAALASADEANRRWEECRALVDQLRVENAALRAALAQNQMLPPGATSLTAINNIGHPEDGKKPGGGDDLEDSGDGNND